MRNLFYFKDISFVHQTKIIEAMGYGHLRLWDVVSYLGMLLQVKCFSISGGNRAHQRNEGERSAYPSALIVNVSLLKCVILTL